MSDGRCKHGLLTNRTCALCVSETALPYQYKTIIKSLRQELANTDAEVEKLKGDIQYMVKKAAGNHLPAYREQSEALLSMTIRAEKSEAEVERLTADRDDWRKICEKECICVGSCVCGFTREASTEEDEVREFNARVAGTKKSEIMCWGACGVIFKINRTLTCEAFWVCCGIHYPYTAYRCTRCGRHIKAEVLYHSKSIKEVNP